MTFDTERYPVDAQGLPITLEGQSAYVAQLRRPCAGPLVRRPKEMADLWARWHALAKAYRSNDNPPKAAQDLVAFVDELTGQAQAVARELGVDPRSVIVKPVTASSAFDDIKRAALPLIRLRGHRVGRGCGVDLTPVYVAAELDRTDRPFDGQTVAYTCPKCGADHTGSTFFPAATDLPAHTS